MRRLGDVFFLGFLALLSLSLAEQTARPRVQAAGPAPAPAPAAPPAPGWKAVAGEVAGSIFADRLMANAAAVTFYGLLALFPALATLISLFGLFANPIAIEHQLNTMQGVVPGGGLDLVRTQVHSLISAPHQALGIGALVGLVIALWSANSGTKAIFDALNVAFEVTETRSFVRLTLVTLGFTLAGLAVMVLAIGAFVALPAVVPGTALLGILRWPLLLLLIVLAIDCLYRFGPDRRRARFHWLSWGSAAAGLAWMLASAGFSFYVANFGSYNKTYGSLGAAVGFMTWIWISTTIVLIGAELNDALEKRGGAGSVASPARAPAPDQGG